MGIVSKQINKRKNQELAAERAYRTQHTPAQILERLQAYAEAENAEIRALIQSRKMGRLERWANDGQPRAVLQYYDLLAQGDTIFVAFARPVKGMVEGIDKSWQLQGAWLARLTLLSVSESATEIRIVLIKWSTGGNDGKMQNRSWYEGLVDRFIVGLPARELMAAPRR